jgi:glutathione synthase/RimK-type ligase-like ATP-grasp enzyme
MTAVRPRRVPTWRGVATRIDLLRSTGARHAWRRWRRDRALEEVVQGRREDMARALWTDAAREVGATVTEVGPARFEIRLGEAVVRAAGQVVAVNVPEAVERAADKLSVYGLLAEAGLPVPEHVVFTARDLRTASAFLERGPIPCVVKPVTGTGGDGVTGGVRSISDLRRAALAASRFAPRLLLERQAEGDVFRLLVLDDEVIDVVRRLRPTITGDGRSTVDELVFAEYDRRLRGDGDPGIKPFAADLDCMLSLERSGLSLHSVLPAGRSVQVKTVTNYNRPADNAAARVVAGDLRADAVAAAKALGLRLAGIDVVTPLPSADLVAGVGVVVDVNAAPALHHHTHAADARGATRVAATILRALLETPPR